MFWRWNSEFDYMETEPGKHLSQTEALSQRLFGLTFWGDYGGTSLTRYAYTLVQETAPDIIYDTRAAHGQGWTLAAINGHTGQLHALIELMRDMADEDWIYDEGYSEWEWETIDAELFEGSEAEWLINDTRRHLESMADWDGNTLIGDKGTDEWAQLLYAYGQVADVSPYFESATSIISYDPAELAEFALEEYARSYNVNNHDHIY